MNKRTIAYIMTMILLVCSLFMGNTFVENVYAEDAAFENYLNEQGFPDSYKPYLRQIHEEYPNWKFVADKNGVDWEKLFKWENGTRRSLIPDNATYKASCKSSAANCYDPASGKYIPYDSGIWVQASPMLVGDSMDPRNFLTTDNDAIFMFIQLDYNPEFQTEDAVKKVMKDTFMQDENTPAYHDLTYNGVKYTYSQAVMLAGQTYKINPIYLAARIRNEQGVSGLGDGIRGFGDKTNPLTKEEGCIEYTVGEGDSQTTYYFKNIYNYFSIGAYTCAGDGLIFASSNVDDNGNPGASLGRPWNTRMKSIFGGTEYIAGNYFARGQNTIYYQKFDINFGGHQYYTNIRGHIGDARNNGRAYSEEMRKNLNLTFEIPVYDNMPAAPMKVPTYVQNGLTYYGTDGLEDGMVDAYGNHMSTIDFQEYIKNSDSHANNDNSANNANVQPAPELNKEGWVAENGDLFWYENNIKQGLEGRGKEIYDPSTDAWYWLDAVDGGKIAKSKDVYQESAAGEWAENEDGTGKWVRYDSSGHMVKGWDINSNGTYYFDMTYGTMAKGWTMLEDRNLYFDENTGALQVGLGWITMYGSDYWYENNVKQGLEGRGKEIYDPSSDAWYWLDSIDSGRKAKSKDVYQESAAGEWAENEDGTGKWVRYDSEGHMIKGWDENEDGIYYFDMIYGTMAKGWVEIDGEEFYFNTITGLLEE